MIDRGRDSIPPLPRGLPRQAVSQEAGPADAHAIIPAKAHSRHSRESMSSRKRGRESIHSRSS